MSNGAGLLLLMKILHLPTISIMTVCDIDRNSEPNNKLERVGNCIQYCTRNVQFNRNGFVNV